MVRYPSYLTYFSFLERSDCYGDLVASRTLNELYIYLDIAFLVILGAFLWITKRRVAFWFGIAGGLLYFAVDYGIFYLALHTRTVTGANTELFLLWLSMSLVLPTSCGFG